MEGRECTLPAIAKYYLITTNSTAEATSGILRPVLDSLVEGKGKRAGAVYPREEEA